MLCYDFAGRVAVVTGGRQGIGAAIAGALRAAGASVAVWDLIADDENGFCGEVDVTDDASVARATEATRAQFGGIDIVVNNAGFAGPTVPVEAYDPAMWRRIIDINLTGTFNVCRGVIPALRASRHGRIVNIASLAGKEGTPNASAYSAAKAGVIALTKSLGKELAGTSVLVNAIAPAAVDRPLLAQMAPAHVETMVRKSPLGRLGKPEEVAALALWLASDACSFSTGAVFDLSGGRATY
ncbi:SDR family oxidoreductase [Acidocella sp.]|uniref:SDR family oxidoreductase n=1 Tax=Acidocella sp. TaxID=50710 RepID=UPI002F4080E7